MKLVNEGRTLKLLQMRKKVPYLIEVNLFDATPEMKKLDNKFEDKSIFKYGLTYVQHHDSLNGFINYQLAKGNQVVFPEKEFQIALVLNREDKQNKAFYVYEIFHERMTRKVSKAEKPKPGQEESDACDVDLEGRVLIYCCGDELVF